MVYTGRAVAGASGGTGVYEYYWNTGPSEDTQQIEDLEAGLYTVMVKDANNCTSESTVIISDSLVETNAIATVKVFPVPSIDKFTIEYKLINKNATTLVVNSYDNKTVFKTNIAAGSLEEQKLSVDCSSWSEGVYFVLIKDISENVLISKQIVVVR